MCLYVHVSVREREREREREETLCFRRDPYYLLLFTFQVNDDLTIFPNDDEVIGVEPLFSKSQCSRGQEEDICCMNSTATDNYLVLDDFPFSDEFCNLNSDSSQFPSFLYFF